MQVLCLGLEAPLMAFGGPQVDHRGPTERFPATSQLAGLLGNALGFTHGQTDRLQALQDRVRFAAALVRPGADVMDYQTADLGQAHLREPSWTTWGRTEHRVGGAARFGTHIRQRHYRAGSAVALALALAPADETPRLRQIQDALDRPARPLFIGRKPCLPAERIVVGLLDDAISLTLALQELPFRFPERWARMTREQTVTSMEAQWPDSRGGSGREDLHWVVDERDWRNQIHGGARVVVRGNLELASRPSSDGVSS